MVYLSISKSLLLGRLVIPMLEVLIDGSLVRVLVLLQHCGEAPSGSGGVLVHCVVESCITGVVLLFELCGCHVEKRWRWEWKVRSTKKLLEERMYSS